MTVPPLPRVTHPGPPGAERVRALACRATPVVLTLPAGAALIAAAGAVPSAWLRFSGAMDPLRYVIPADAPDDNHAAWYSDTFAPHGGGQVRAGLFTGMRDGAPFLHCHGEWDVAQGPRAGHILPDQAAFAEDVHLTGWRTHGAALRAAQDAETNFKLFTPVATAPGAAEGAQDGRAAVLVRIAPNEDLGPALVRAASEAGLTRALVFGIGSLIGATMADGRNLPPGPTEFLIRAGMVAGARVDLEIVIIDKSGAVIAGRMAALGNPVFVTVEALLIAE